MMQIAIIVKTTANNATIVVTVAMIRMLENIERMNAKTVTMVAARKKKNP